MPSGCGKLQNNLPFPQQNDFLSAVKLRYSQSQRPQVNNRRNKEATLSPLQAACFPLSGLASLSLPLDEDVCVLSLNQRQFLKNNKGEKQSNQIIFLLRIKSNY